MQVHSYSNILIIFCLLLKIHGDFVLISGDTVSNMSLTQALIEHKERKKKDSNAVMTMVIKRSKPSRIALQSRLGTDELFMAIDPNTKQLLYYEDKADHSKGSVYLDKLLLVENTSISLHNDKQVNSSNLSIKSILVGFKLLINLVWKCHNFQFFFFFCHNPIFPFYF